MDLAGRVDLLLPSISAVAACLRAIGALECIRAMPIMRRESAGTLHWDTDKLWLASSHTHRTERTSEARDQGGLCGLSRNRMILWVFVVGWNGLRLRGI